MKAGIVGLIIIVLIALAGAAYFTFRKPAEPVNESSNFVEMSPQGTSDNLGITETQSIDSNLSIGSDSDSKNLAGNYLTGLGADGYKNSAGDKTVIFFYADWCPTCRPVDAEFKNSIGKIPTGIEIYRVNYNDSETDEADKALAKKYGVTYQHTFVQVDKEGNEITKWNGGGLDKLISSIK